MVGIKSEQNATKFEGVYNSGDVSILTPPSVDVSYVS